jgi:hypothetical protein
MRVRAPTAVAGVARTTPALDTPIAIPAGVDRVRVVALDARGQALGSSAVTPAG